MKREKEKRDLHRLAILLIVCLILIPGQAQGVGPNVEAPAWVQPNPDGGSVSVPVSLSRSATGGSLPVSTFSAGSILDLTNLRPKLDTTNPTIRVGLISSGVDRSIFPTSALLEISAVNIDGDAVGYGSYAASTLLQLARVNTTGITTKLSISSYNVYPTGVFSPTTLTYALDWMYRHASNLDVVLLGFPPTDFLDPITAAMSNNSWNKAWDGVLDRSSPAANGSVIGIPLEDNTFNEQGSLEYNLVNSLRLRMKDFDLVNRWIAAINSAGLSVIVPAGDVGPNPQTVMGLANLGSVITVGGYNPIGQISPKGSAGPSIDLKVKPDFLAPTGLVGVLPPASALATLLKSKNQLFAAGELKPNWVGDPDWAPTATARVDTTLGASTVAAIAAGAIGAGGLRDPALQRAALLHASTNIEGAPIWRQGSGVLGGVSQTVSMPTVTSTTTVPFALTHGDLGFQPEGTGIWNTTVTVSTGTVTGATVTLTDFIGVDLFGKVTTGTAASNDPPTLTVVTNTVGVVLDAVAKVTSTVTGLYCGSVNLDLANSTVTVDDDQPAVCLSTGIEPMGRVLEIHNQSVNADSFMLMPALPPGATVLDHPLSKLPIDPTNFGLITAISETRNCTRYNEENVPLIDLRTTCGGHARLPRVMAGYYRVRGFSDYGGQSESTVTNSSTGATETVQRDLGRPLIYSTFDTLLLPKAPDLNNRGHLCNENFQKWEDWAGHGEPTSTVPDYKKWKYCTEKTFETAKSNAESQEQDFHYVYDRFLGGFNVSQTVNLITRTPATSTATATSTADSPLINMGFFRKRTEGANIGRVIDIIDPCKELPTKTFYSDQTINIASLVSATAGAGPWTVGCTNAPNSLSATLLGGQGGSASVGWATAEYSFNIPTPNFGTHMSLNFAYNLTNAFIVVVVMMGPDTAVGLVTPAGTFQLPPGVPTINTSQVPAVGQAEGKANFEFNLNAKGYSRGKIVFAIAPANLTTTYQPTYISKAEIQDDPANNKTLSFELSTFEVNPWPAINYPNLGKSSKEQLLGCPPNYMQDCGHLFGFHSQYNPVTVTSQGAWKGQIGKRDPSSGQAIGDNCRDISSDTHKARVCEDWTVVVHSPKLPEVVPAGIPGVTTTAQYQMQAGSSLMDVFDFSLPNRPSILEEVIDAGGQLYVPAPRYSVGTAMLAYKGLPNSVAQNLFSRPLRSNGSHFELLKFPIDLLAAHPNQIEVCINDGPSRPTSTVIDGNTAAESICRGHHEGTDWIMDRQAVPIVPKVTGTVGANVSLSPYIPYSRQATLWYWPSPPALPEPPP